MHDKSNAYILGTYQVSTESRAEHIDVESLQLNNKYQNN